MSTGRTPPFARQPLAARSRGVRTHRGTVLARLALAGILGPSCGPSASPVAPASRPTISAPSARVPRTDDAAPRGAAKGSSSSDSRATAALARIPEIARAVAEIRKLRLKHAVPAEVQSQDDFRVFLDRQVKKEIPAEKAAQSVRALVRLGLLKEPIDLGKTIEDAMISQAGAYYDPDTKKFYLVLVPDDANMLDVMSAHELTHALDDQYFDLGAYVDDPKHELSNDEQQARRFVGEGEATLVMLAYQAKVAAHQDIFAPENRRMETMVVAAFTSLDSEQLAKAAADNPAVVDQMGPSMKASIEAMATIPPFILEPLFSAYTKGAAAVAAVRDRGGWDAVAALYTTPPESTEQLLHPADKLIAKRDHPVRITLPPYRLEPIDTDVVGELTMRVYFKVWGDPAPDREVLGWGGDRYAAFDDGGKVFGVWLTSWDTDADAERFERAYDASLAKRFVGDAALHAHPMNGVAHADGTVTASRRAGKEVAIVDGATAANAPGLFRWLQESKRAQAK